MALLNTLKISFAVAACIFALLAGIIELRKNPDYWLNRWFALYFISIGFGAVTYTIYHVPTLPSHFIIPLMVSSHILFNLGFASLLMTTFILDHSEKLAMTRKYLLTVFGLYVLATFGYFVWVPELNMGAYKQGLVDTETETFWFLIVNLYRVVIVVYVIAKFIQISRKTSGVTQTRMKWFTVGTAFFVSAVFINLVGGILGSPFLEVLGLASFIVSFIVTVKGFLIE